MILWIICLFEYIITNLGYNKKVKKDNFLASKQADVREQ